MKDALPVLSSAVVDSVQDLKTTTAFTSNAVVALTIYHAALAEVAYLTSSDEELHAVQKRSHLRRQRASSAWKRGFESPGSTAAEACSQWLRSITGRGRAP